MSLWNKICRFKTTPPSGLSRYKRIRILRQGKEDLVFSGRHLEDVALKFIAASSKGEDSEIQKTFHILSKKKEIQYVKILHNFKA
jgi:hypothetical protein